MGTVTSICCKRCNVYCGECPILNISQPGSNINGYNLCIKCYEQENKIYKGKVIGQRVCDLCNYNSNKDSPVFLIHWYGKLDGYNICSPCLFLQKYKL